MEYTDIELKNEQWRDIDGYDGAYQVSDIGRVRSRKSGEWKVVKQEKTTLNYSQVCLYKNGKGKRFYVHRLVAQAFIPNDDDSKTIINHRNSIRDCNRVENLEWCTQQYNNTYNDKHHKCKRRTHIRRKLKELYRPDLTITENLKIFKENGIECCDGTVFKLRNDLGLICSQPKYNKVKDLYRSDLTYKENLEIFKEQGVECSEIVIRRIRRDLGLINHKPRKPKQVDDVINQRQRPLERF